MANPPKFTSNSELARYIHKDEIKGSKVSSAAFMPNPGDDHLSVNSLEIESVKDIAEYYREVFQEAVVNICTRKISEYKASAEKTSVQLRYDRNTNNWTFQINGQPKPAFKHRPRETPPPKSISHCGVEFVNVSVDYLDLKKIARRLSGKRPHIFKLHLSDINQKFYAI